MLKQSRVEPAAARPRLIGSETPRIFTPPLRELTRATTKGYEVANFAQLVLGEPLLPWQRWLAIHALELHPTGGYRFRTVLGLAARQNGKTTLLRTIILWKLFMDGARLVLGAAQTQNIAKEVWQSACDMAKSNPQLRPEVDRSFHAAGNEHLLLTNGARYKITASTRKAGRGLSVDLLLLDEIREQRTWEAWSALSKTTMARADAQIWAISNAGDDGSVVLNTLRDAALHRRDDSIGLFEWSAPEGCELDDPEAWVAANPGLGHTITEQAIRGSMATDPPNVFRTEVLCQKVDVLDAAVDFTAWKSSVDTAGSLEAMRDRLILCLDVAPDGQHVSLAGAAEGTDGRFRVEMFADWRSPDAARRDLPDIVARINPAAIAWFPSGPAAAIAADMRAMGAIEISGGKVGEACMEFAELVSARRIVHPGDPLLNAHISGSKKLRSGDGWRFSRRGVGHVDAAYAAAGAIHAIRTVPVEKPLPRPMIV